MEALNFMDAVEAYKVFNEASSIAWRQDLEGSTLTYEEWNTLSKLCDKVCTDMTNLVGKMLEGEG